MTEVVEKDGGKYGEADSVRGECFESHFADRIGYQY